MIERKVRAAILELLEEFPAVAVLWHRQVGKTALSEEIAESLDQEYIYLDSESPIDQAKLSEPEAYFELHKGWNDEGDHRNRKLIDQIN